jgi:hypothetical protein
VIIAYVWGFKGPFTAWGHASLYIDTKPQTYMSWWPAPDRGRREEDRVRRPKLGDKAAGSSVAGPVAGMIYSAPAVVGQSYTLDVEGEEGAAPDFILPVHGLDELKIREWWAGFVANPPHWTTLGVNCSMVVAYALRAGGADNRVRGVSGWWHSWNTVWSPNDIIDFVRVINRAAGR